MPTSPAGSAARARLRSPPPARAEPLLRWLAAARALLAGCRADDWLIARWQDEALRIRPLASPYFVPADLQVTGAERLPLAAPLPEEPPWQVAGPGERVRLASPGGDVVRLLIAAHPTLRTRVVLRESGAVRRTLAWPARATPTASWREVPVRAVLPVRDRSLTVEVQEGAVRVAAVALRQRADLLAVLGSRATRRAVAIDPGRCPSPRAASLLAALGQSFAATDAQLVLAAAAAVHRQAASYADAARVPLQRAALARISEVLDGALAPGLLAPERPAAEAANPDDVAVLAALTAALAPPRDGARPIAAARAEQQAASRAGDAGSARLAWLRATRLRSLDPTGPASVEAELHRVRDADGPLCPVAGPGGLRWTLLDQPTRLITVAALGPSHTRVMLRGASEAPEPESLVRIDDVAVPVHAAAGLHSFVAVAPGPHRFDRDPGAPAVLARIARDGVAPCGELRDLTRWVRADPAVSFSLPPGAPTVARLELGPNAVGAAPIERLTILAGSARHELWLRPGAAGAIEVPVAADVTTLRVELPHPALVRMLARYHAEDEAPVVSLPPPGAAAAPALTAPPSEPERLGRIRAHTRALELARDDAERARLRHERGLDLLALGYRRFAALDDPSLGQPVEQALGDAYQLEAGSPAVVPRGAAAQIPPLPLPADLAPLVQARRQLAAGDLAAVVATLRGRTDSAADALLLAVTAERLTDLGPTIAAYEAIGLAHRSSAALGRAAALLADQAAASADGATVRRAYALAERCEQLGGDARGTKARLAPAVRSVAVERADATAGFALLERIGEGPASLPEQLRRALSDAPEEAVVLDEGSRWQLRLEPRRAIELLVSAHCRHLDAASSACRFALLLDGEQAGECGWEGGFGRCAVRIGPGRHRVEVVPTSAAEQLGWVLGRLGRSDEPLPVRVLEPWHEITADRPLSLRLAGPTVATVTARALGTEPPPAGPTSLSIALDGAPLVSEALPQGIDASASRLGGVAPTPVAERWERRIVVLAGGGHELVLRPSKGRVLVRVTLVEAVGAARPRTMEAEPALAGVPVAVVPSPPLRPAVPPVIVAPADGAKVAVTLGARLVAPDLADTDGAELTAFARRSLGPYGETWGAVSRALITERLWAELQLLGRVRAGPTSWGTRGYLELGPSGAWPGAELRAQLVAQPLATGPAVGLDASLLPFWRIGVGADCELEPWLAFTLLRVDEAARRVDGADRDVYTPYDASHPRHLATGLHLVARPLLDTQARAGTSLRTRPDIDGIDRVDLDATVHALPGRGLAPWVELGWRVSVRPRGPGRASTFVRNTWTADVTVWRWLAAGQRLRVGLAGKILADAPAPAQPTPPLSGMLWLGYDLATNHDLGHFRPSTMVFADRLAEW